jgi:hypothetical protein
MRLIAIFVIILGLAGLVLGVVFVTQATSAEKQVLDSIAPLKSLSEINPTYDKITAQYNQLVAAELANIQAKTAAPSVNFAYVSGQRALLGLAKSNVGLAMFIRLSGIAGIVIGLGMGLAGFALMKKA